MAITTNTANMKRCKIVNNVVEGPEETFNIGYTSLGKLLFDRLKSDDNFVGQVESKTGIKDTYKDMKDRSVRCAIWMKKNGVLPEDVIAGCYEKHLNDVIPCLASLYIGAISVCFVPTSSVRDMQHDLMITKPKMVFASGETAAVLSAAAKRANLELRIIVFGEVDGYEKFSEIIREPEVTEVECFECSEIENPDQTAMIFFTSGTTGSPKGAAFSHSTMMKKLKYFERFVIEKQIMLSYIYISCMLETLFSFIALTKNMKRIVVLSERHNNLACDIIEKYKAQFLLTYPTLINRILKSETLKMHDISSLESVLVLGEVFPRESQEAFTRYVPNAILYVSYGMTEFPGLAAFQTSQYKPRSCGFLAENTKMKVVDPETGKILGSNQQGELCFKSNAMMTCYVGNPHATSNIIDDNGWGHSGDMGFYDDDGEIYVVGRLKEIINYQSDKICPADIESILLTYPGVREAAVVGLPHETDGEVPMAFVVTMTGSKITENELNDLVAAELSDCKRLRGGVKFIDKMPSSTATGKLKRSELQALAETFPKNRS